MSSDFDSDVAGLVERFCRGHEGPVAEVLRLFGPALHCFLRRAFGDSIRNEIDQIVLDAVETARECRANFDPTRGPFLYWLTGIARNLAVKHLEGLGGDGKPLEVATDPERLSWIVDHRRGERDDAKTRESADRDALVRRALDALNDVQRHVLLADASGPEPLSSRELGRELGLRDSTVRSARKRGRDALRALLVDLGIEAFILCNTPEQFSNSGSRSSASFRADSNSGNGERGTGNGERGTGNGERRESILAFQF